MSLNLLPSQAKFQALKIKHKQIASKVMLTMAVIWVLMAMIVFGANFVIGYNVTDSQKKYNVVLTSFMTMVNNVQVDQQLKTNAKLVGESLDSRFEYGKSFELIQSLFPEGITLNKYDLQNRGMFQVQGTTSGKSNVDQLENIAADINSGKKEGLAKCRMTALTVSNNIWNFSMEVELK